MGSTSSTVYFLTLFEVLSSKSVTTSWQTGLPCMKKLGLSHRPTFRKNYLQPALEAGLIERTLPDKPNSSLQQYRLRQRH